MLRSVALMIAISGGAVSAQDEGLPGCDTLASGVAGRQDCTLDNGLLFLTFRFERSGFAHDLTVTQSTAEGGDRETSAPITVWDVTEAPAFRDLDDDGTAELFIPAGGGGGEVVFRLWTLDARNFYAESGRLVAPSLDALERRGDLIVATVPGETPETATEKAWLFDAGTLIEVYRLRLDSGAQTCTLVETERGVAALNDPLLIADCEARMGWTGNAGDQEGVTE